MDKVLCFSGGKDSLAVLEVLRERGELDEVLVIWADSGDGYPGKREVMEELLAGVPHSLVVRGNRYQWAAENGWPTDVLPESMTHFGNVIRGKEHTGLKLVSARACCTANLWDPMAKAIIAVGAKVVYRGDRKSDTRRAPVADGQTVDGIEFRFPVFDWTTEEVMAYVGDRLPVYYGSGELASQDCMHCTAYLDENAVRINRLPPESKKMVHYVLQIQRQAVVQELRNIDEVLNG